MMSLYLRTAAVLAAVALIFVGSGRGILLFMPVLAVYLLACALLSASRSGAKIALSGCLG